MHLQSSLIYLEFQVPRNGGSVVGQPKLPNIFGSDGVHLSPLGCNIYLANMARGIVAVIGRCGWAGGSEARLKPSPIYRGLCSMPKTSQNRKIHILVLASLVIKGRSLGMLEV